jgi:hypothetical protein
VAVLEMIQFTLLKRRRSARNDTSGTDKLHYSILQERISDPSGTPLRHIGNECSTFREHGIAANRLKSTTMAAYRDA